MTQRVLQLNRFASLAGLAAAWQVPPATIRAVMEAEGIPADLLLDDTVYVNRATAERIARYLRQRRLWPASAGARALMGH